MRYMKVDSLRESQLLDKDKLIDIERKKGRRDKWIFGGIGLGAGILAGTLLGIYVN